MSGVCKDDVGYGVEACREGDGFGSGDLTWSWLGDAKVDHEDQDSADDGNES